LTDHSTTAAHDDAFDWKNCWYPVSFLKDIPRDRPTGVTLYDKALVLFFDDTGGVHCLRDKCPHRAARLSHGQIINGRLECLYHGWQFRSDGRCQHIPQLPAGREIPDGSHVRCYRTAIQREILWIWAGDPERCDVNLIPKGDNAATYSVTFQMDLPYDQGYLIENIIDIAHVHIAHHGVRGGGLRESAKPLEFKIEESSIAGIRSTFRSVGLVRTEESPALSGAMVEFVAPNLIRYISGYRDPNLIAGLELYSLPLGKNKCRLLYRKYSNFTSPWERLKPRWLHHLNQCKILEQDMAVVVGQVEQIEHEAANLRDIWLPLRTSDQLVVEYRKWLDRFGRDLPFYRGFATARSSSGSSTARLPADRHILHTGVCGTCSKAYRNLDRAIRVLWVFVATVLVAQPMIGSERAPIAFALAALVGLIGIAGARRLQSRF
jgi:phenylpropionate dioxygenase-like ring-hydroxylating dioxygenase large terminal subunit